MNYFSSILIGFLVVGSVITIGYLIRKLNVIDGSAEKILNTVAFYLMSPALFLVVITSADVNLMFSGYMYASVLGILVTLVITASILALQNKNSMLGITLYSSSTVFNNLGNIGIPLTLYTLGTTGYVAPLISFQLIVLTPIILIFIELNHGPKQKLLPTLMKPFKNPLIVSSIVGTLLLILDIQIPPAVFAPLELLGYAAIPTLLLAFGVSFVGVKPLISTREHLPEILLTIGMKAVFMPLITVIIGISFFGLSGTELFAAALVASFPAGQTIYNFAITYNHRQAEIRDVTLVSTILSLPVILLFTAFLG